MEEVVLVDVNNNVLGYMEKMEAHYKGELHRAFSVFIFNSKKQVLLQKRALDKYHSAGLWTNTCCSHPRKNESFIHAAHRRLNEEMGMSAHLDKAFSFIYKAHLDQGLIEHELDWVFLGKSDVLPLINSNEVASYKYVDFNSLLIDLEENPDLYTSWLKICINRVAEHVTNNKYFEK